MGIKRTEVIRSCLVERPNGETEIVDVYQDFIDASSMDNPNAELAGMKRCQLRTGRSVNFINEDTFEDIFPKERLEVLKEL